MHTGEKKRSVKTYEMDMCQGPLLGKILVYTVPLIFTGILQLLFNAADIVVVGQFVGEDALAAVGSTGSLVNLLINVFMGISIGTNVLVARFYGANQPKELEETVHTAILLAI
ncbi:MAG: MATE family efflux transporter, partial [Lachnospiraceae bacterium]|nr:MATE family efflux transporter [Lachnospiraceae bacterium]